MDIVVHLTMEEEGTRVSLDMEEVDTSLKLHVMVTAAAVEAMGIGSCSTISNVKKHTEGATANLSLLPMVLLVLVVRTETLEHLMEGTTLDTEVATAHLDLMVLVRTALDHLMEDTTLDTAWGCRPVPLSRLQVHQLIAHLSSLVRVLPPLTRQQIDPLPGQHRILHPGQQPTILPTLMVLTEAMDLTEELPVTEDTEDLLVMAATEATVEVMDLTEEE